MAYICLDCGHIFEEGEQAVQEESHGLDNPPYEKFSVCPVCGGAYEESVRCAICGGEHLEEDLFGGVCKECIDDCRNDFETCYEVSGMEKSCVRINSFLASVFDQGDIEQILIEYIRQRWRDVDCSQFIDEDLYWFGNQLAKEVKKNEARKG